MTEAELIELDFEIAIIENKIVKMDMTTIIIIKKCVMI